MLNYVSTEKAPKAIGPYSQAVVCSGMVYCSGQIPLDPVNGIIVEGGIAEQTVRVLENLKAVLEEAGSSLENAVKVTVFMKNMGDFTKVNEIYSKYFTTNPARSAVEVARLPRDVLIEIECIAAVK